MYNSGRMTERTSALSTPSTITIQASYGRSAGLNFKWSGLPEPVPCGRSEDAIPFSGICGQSSVVAEVAFAQPARKKALFPGNERAGIERGWTDLDQTAINEVADFDRSDRRLRDIGDYAKLNRPVFASIFVYEDRAAVAVDLSRPVAHAHTYRDTLPVARIYVTWNIKLIIYDPLPGRV